MGHGGWRAHRRRSRRQGHGFLGWRIPDCQPRNAGIEWLGARRPPARVPGDPRRPRTGRTAQPGHLRKRSKDLALILSATRTASCSHRAIVLERITAIRFIVVDTSML